MDLCCHVWCLVAAREKLLLNGEINPCHFLWLPICLVLSLLQCRSQVKHCPSPRSPLCPSPHPPPLHRVCSLSSSSFLVTAPTAPSLNSVVLFFWCSELYIGIMQYALFCVWFILFSIMFEIHKCCSFFIFITIYYSPLWTYTTFWLFSKFCYYEWCSWSTRSHILLYIRVGKELLSHGVKINSIFFNENCFPKQK